MKENKQKNKRFAWITQIFDFGQTYSIKGKDKHKLIYNYLFGPLMTFHLILIAIISFLSYLHVIDLKISPIFPTTQIEGISFFLLFSVIPVFLYVIAFLLFRYDIRVPKEEENLTKDKDHLKLVLFLAFLAVIIQFIILLFFYL